MRIFDFKRYVENAQNETTTPYKVGSIIAREPKYRGNTEYFELIEYIGKIPDKEVYQYVAYPLKSNLKEVKGSKLNINLSVGLSQYNNTYTVKEPNGILVSQKTIDADSRRGNEDKIEWVGKKPLCLMTKDEYKKSVTPLLKEYIKFIEKNGEYLALDYGNLKSYYKNDPNIDKNSFAYKYKLGEKKDAPKEVIDKINYYEDKIKELTGFNLNSFSRDEVNSNKKFISLAISDDTYANLLKSGKVNMKNIEEVVADAKLKVPKKLYDVDISVKDDGITLDKETQLINDAEIFKQSIIDMFIDVYNDAAARYYSNFEPSIIKYEEFSKTDISKIQNLDALKSAFEVFATGKAPRIETINGKYDTTTKIHYSYIVDDVFGNKKIFGQNYNLNTNWKDILKEQSIKCADNMFQYYVDRLLMNLKQLNVTEYPIVQGGKLYGFSSKGFDGIVNFKYSNGFNFRIETQVIWAGGYNIQELHMRGLFKYFYNDKNVSNEQIIQLYKNSKN